VIEIVDQHSVRTDLISSGDWVLDAGARGFRFASWFADKNVNVLALDPDPDVKAPMIGFVTFRPYALSKETSFQMLARYKDAEANHLVCVKVPGSSVKENVKVHAWSIGDLMETLFVESFACVKLNIEGAEYEILENWPGPIAKQIAVSFHDHTGANPEGEARYGRILNRLGQWYDVARHVKDSRYCAGENYWDSLFVLKGL